MFKSIWFSMLLAAVISTAWALPSTAQEEDKKSQRESDREQKRARGEKQDRQERRGRNRKRKRRPDNAPKIGQLAPDFKLKSLDGKSTTTLSDYRGKKPVILFFGSYT